MKAATARLLDRLADLDFEVRLGGVAPFDAEIPLVTGVAWHYPTAQLALIAEAGEHADDGLWRQLLFAGSGLRHHLSPDEPAAFGAPVILAVVDDAGRHQLRALAEYLAHNYALFNRVDLNLVLESELADPEKLDDALAPLLPRCRSLLGEEISKAEVQRFWARLRSEIERSSADLDGVFGAFREEAGRDAANALIGRDEQAPALPAPTPISRLQVRNFRSIKEADVELPPVTVVHGPNGGGKSSLLEALELAWAGTSQRKPQGVPAEEYARHLPRNGVGEFSVTVNGTQIRSVSDEPHAELPRCVLTHEAVAALVSQSPEDRYSALLTTTGLEIPDLNERTARLVDQAKQAADEALARAGLPRLPRRDSRGKKHLEAALKSNFAARIPPVYDLDGAEQALADASGGAYRPREWLQGEHAEAALIHADGVVAEAMNAQEPDSVIQALDDAGSKLAPLIDQRKRASNAMQRLAVALDRPANAAGRRARPAAEQAAPISPAVAARWLSHAHGLTKAAEQFRKDAQSIDDAWWRERLLSYADRLGDAALGAPEAELQQRLVRTSARDTQIPPPRVVPDDVFIAAGFEVAPSNEPAVIAPLREVASQLQMQVAALEALAADLRSHPARRFADHAEEVMATLCRFELARVLRREGPILRASEQLVSELLQGRLAPIVRELVAAIVRFEWYFKPLLVPEKGRKVVLGGLATSDADLDARLVLNSAERTVLGVAWFLALHMLQPPPRRRVLALDDPTSAFDPANQAGFISTLRAFARLTRPEQLVLTTHEDPLAAVMAEELAPVDGWPTAVGRLRFQRDASDCSNVRQEWFTEKSEHVEREAELLGLLGEAPKIS